MKTCVTLLCLVAVPALAEEKVSGACEKKHLGQCTEYLGPISEKAEKLCATTHGELKKGATCATGNSEGTCTTTNPEKVALRIHYYKAGKIKDPAEFCKNMLKGTWAGP